MAIKRYSSACARFTINVKVDGKATPIVFNQYNPDEKRRFVDVSDKNIQEQIEKSPDFNVYFRLDYTSPELESEVTETKQLEPEVKPEVTQPEQEKEDEKEVKRFATVVEAKTWMNQQGVPFHKISSKEKIVREGLALGYQIEFES